MTINHLKEFHRTERASLSTKHQDWFWDREERCWVEGSAPPKPSRAMLDPETRKLVAESEESSSVLASRYDLSTWTVDRVRIDYRAEVLGISVVRRLRMSPELRSAIETAEGPTAEAAQRLGVTVWAVDEVRRGWRKLHPEAARRVPKPWIDDETRQAIEASTEKTRVLAERLGIRQAHVLRARKEAKLAGRL